MQTVLALYPFAKQTNDNIEKQNKFLQKISLTGKINATESSRNLFTYTDETIKKFSQLKEALIDALIEENSKKTTGELTLKAQSAIDVLKRNLFERTADVGFLATDSEIISFLRDATYPKEKIEARLQEYVEKYSVYDDVILFDTQGNIKANINPSNTLKQSSAPIIKEALSSDSFIEQFSHIDVINSKDKSLLYAQKILYGNETIGVLCLSFKFKDELKRIFTSLLEEEDLLYMEEAGIVIASSQEKTIPLHTKVSLTKLEGLSLFQHKRIAVKTKTNGYQGYYGLDWEMTAISPSKTKTVSKSLKKQVLPPKLKRIIDDAHEIVDDLGDVIINGELIASKYRQYILSPILESLRLISASLLEDINNAAENLADTVTNTLITNAKISTEFSMDLMDRNLYERANDCRWWALTPAFIEELAKETRDTERLNKLLKEINSLYTVYTDLLIYDTSGTVIACSNDQTFIGTKIADEAASKTLSNKNSQHYFVSAFQNTPYYHDSPSYLYHASIVDEGKTVGGIAVVFDSAVEFQAILEDSTMENKEGFSLFCDQDKHIIASTHQSLNPLDKLPSEMQIPALSSEETIQKFVTFEEKNYLLTIAPSLGYREYKVEDNYKNDLYALSFIAL